MSIYLVAVSGGVDSVVLLHRMATTMADEHDIVVAHVDHGIRAESGDDARFVEGLAAQYGLPYISTQLHLGPNASEDLARTGRYDWLFAEAAKRQAALVTAHHGDDITGSVAINLTRGTGWRGLAVLNRAGINRPLLSWRKKAIYQYALSHQLEWVEDATNQLHQYLRNRLRTSITQLSDADQQQLAHLRTAQVELADEIDDELARFMPQYSGVRYFYNTVPESVAIELLRAEIAQTSGVKPTSRAAERALVAVKTARAGAKCDVADGTFLSFSKAHFVVESRPGVVH